VVDRPYKKYLKLVCPSLIRYNTGVQLSALWQNCPSYIHRYQKVQPSRYVPREASETPLAEWKRIDLI
jgi:hypothetical protein